MKKSTFLLFVLLVSSSFTFSQVKKDSLNDNYIYPPESQGSFTPKESWKIHRAAYIKQLKAKGLTDNEFNIKLISYEKQKEEFLAKVKEQHRIAEIQRKKANKQRALAAIERKKADKQRKLAVIQRKKADELRKLADIERKKADEQRVKSGIQRLKTIELIKQANIERAKADKQRKLAEIQRIKAEKERKKAQEWRKNAENILTKNITLSKQSNNSSKPILFKVTSKTTLRIGIRANISSGTALIEIYNPEGTKEGELSLKFNSQSISNQEKEALEYTSGAFDKTIPDAKVGDWKIKISSYESEGNVAMSVSKYIKPTMNE
ncbi:hypothetical protein [uncultured Lacinutrix sp.]|uniref:hypothetical protein n=1 Tax=uncultured Lacinutrix sp. TaxID=574032 RepID=UPI002625254B|nr:hypothetical protein [uncultured Lacinutrix sp.]